MALFFLGYARHVEAVGCENWASNFFHVVSKHDIVPRMLLTPFESIVESFIAILPHWQGIIGNDNEDIHDSFIQMLIGLFLIMSYSILIQ